MYSYPRLTQCRFEGQQRLVETMIHQDMIEEAEVLARSVFEACQGRGMQVRISELLHDQAISSRPTFEMQNLVPHLAHGSSQGRKSASVTKHGVRIGQ